MEDTSKAGQSNDAPYESQNNSGKQTIWVRSTEKPKDDGGNVNVLWEKDSRHPKGEALIAGRKPVEVGVTPAVSLLLRDGKIVKVGPPKPASK